jgi:ketosteroid isomerase-like protein
MSTDSNIEFVKKAYADFLRGDVAAILAGLADNVEWITPGEGVPTEGVRHGKAEVMKFFQLVAESWNFTAFEPRDYVATGDTVVAIGSYAGTARGTGKSFSAEWTMVWKIRGCKLEYFRENTDTQRLKDAVTGRAAA